MTKHHNKNLQPVLFRWKFGGRNVFLTGTFDDWQASVPMMPDPEAPEEHIATLYLDRSKAHEFKFIVDGTWRLSADFETTDDNNGNFNNILYPLPPQLLQTGFSHSKMYSSIPNRR